MLVILVSQNVSVKWHVGRQKICGLSKCQTCIYGAICTMGRAGETNALGKIYCVTMISTRDNRYYQLSPGRETF
jgi:hypothetical protein